MQIGWKLRMIWHLQAPLLNLNIFLILNFFFVILIWRAYELHVSFFSPWSPGTPLIPHAAKDLERPWNSLKLPWNAIESLKTAWNARYAPETSWIIPQFPWTTTGTPLKAPVTPWQTLERTWGSLKSHGTLFWIFLTPRLEHCLELPRHGWNLAWNTSEVLTWDSLEHPWNPPERPWNSMRLPGTLCNIPEPPETSEIPQKTPFETSWDP